MLRFIFKVFVVLWPFLKNVVFKDRTVIEVIRDNKHITLMLFMVLLMMLTIVNTVNKLTDVRSTIGKNHEKLSEAELQVIELKQQIQLLKSTIKECPQPHDGGYNKSWIIETLNDGNQKNVP